MKENKYDDEVFFNKYKEMSRSVYGLKGAGEHPVFTAYGSQDWYYDDQGNILHFPVDKLLLRGKTGGRVSGREGYKIPPPPDHVSGNPPGKRVFHTPRGGAPDRRRI